MSLPKPYLTKFRKLINEVLETNEFYKEKFKAAGIVSADQIKTWKDFYSLPFTTRQELITDQQKNPPFGTNLTRPISDYTYVIRTSGTSTGIPFFQPLTTEEHSRMSEVMAQGYVQMGMKKGDIACYFTSSYAYPLFYEASRKIGARMVPVEDYKSIDFFDRLKALNVNILHSFPTAIFELIELAQDRKINLKKIGIKKIFTIGEIGGGHTTIKSYFEKSWNAKVTDHIGQLESGTLAVQCKKTQLYHLLDKWFIPEVFEINSDKRAKKGELVLTSLWRQDYPLIRYRTGDIVEIDYSRCPCGKKIPHLVGGILGRSTGQIKLRSFFVYPEDIERIIRQNHYIKDYQIICKREKGIDNLDIYLEVSLKTNWDILNTLLDRLGETIGFTPNIYPVLPKTLPRFGVRKGKRFSDLRFNPQLGVPVSSNRKTIDKILMFLFKWNNRVNNLRNYFFVLREILSKKEDKHE